jgi:23S rRNA (uracil1939-C5)-methyltransferase
MLLTVDKLIYGGDGLARTNGKTVFVPFVLPGEQVEAKLVEDRKSFARAEAVDITAPSQDRASPECPYYGACGGCQYQHASYPAQLGAKRDIWIESLRRTAGVELEVPLQVVSSPQPYGYRNRTRVHVQHQSSVALGYFRAGTHELLSVRECPISSPLINRAIAALCSAVEAGAIPPAVREIEIFAEEADRECLLELYVGARRPGDQELERFAEVIARELPECVGIHAFADSATAKGRVPVLQQVASAGESSLDYSVGAHTYRVSAGSFFQVNRYAAPLLVDLVTRETSGRLAVDLYAGAGLFAVPLSESFEQVVAVEASPFSYADLEANLPEGAKKFCQTTEAFLRHRPREVAGADLVVVDPPRAGLGTDTAALLAKALPKEVRYVSCDPTTLARDLRVLLDSGYRIEEAHLVDMFPQTFHIESFVRLTSRRHE